MGEAETILAGAILERQKEAARPKRITVDQIFDDYLAEHVEPNVTDTARQKLAIAVLRPIFGKLTPGEITAKQSQDYIRKRRHSRRLSPGVNQRHAHKPISDSTMRRELNVLVSAIEHARRNKRITIDDVPTIDLPPESPEKDVWLTREQADRLLVVAQGPELDAKGKVRPLTRARLFISIALGTAARRRAIESLTWNRVDLERGLIDFRKDRDQRTTKKRRGIVPISDDLAVVLRRAEKEKKTLFVLGHDGDTIKTFQTAVKSAGMAWVTRHTLRHTWATWAAQSGRVSMWEISKVMGITLDTAERRYAHCHPTHLRSAVNFNREEPNASDRSTSNS